MSISTVLGLRRSAFNSTPLRVKPTEAKKSSMTASYTLHPTSYGAVSESVWYSGR